jgi:hypothetical protein
MNVLLEGVALTTLGSVCGLLLGHGVLVISKLLPLKKPKKPASLGLFSIQQNGLFWREVCYLE